MLTFVAICVSFFAGIAVGSHVKTLSFEGQDWHIFRWDKSVLGYRPVMEDALIKPGDKVIMGLHLDSNSFLEDKNE